MKILIAGAGIIGLSTALQLADSGAQVQLLDPRPPGHGASLAALGALWPASPLLTAPLQSLHRQSLTLFPNFIHSLTEKSQLPIAYEARGRIEILNSPKSLARAQLEAAAAPQSLSVIDYPTAKSLNPGLALFDHGALHCRLTAQVNVHQLIAALTKACQLANVTFHSIPATELLHNNARITAIQTPQGPIEADIFLITAGAWTPLLSPLLKKIAPIRPAKGQGLAVEMPTPSPLTTIIKSGPTYLIPWSEQSEILIGATTEPEAHYDETPTAAAKENLLAAAAKILPQLAAAKILRHWAGLRPQNPAKPHLPIMGSHPIYKNLHLSVGHYKTGIGLAPLAANLLTKSILQNQIPTALLPFLPRQTEPAA